MAPALCIHCLAAPAEEKDHVLPRSWYPDGTAPTVQHLTVPSCKACGARLKKAEEQTALALMCARGFDKDHVAALRVYDRVRATWDVKAPGSARAFKYRRDRRVPTLPRSRPLRAAGGGRVQGARAAPGCRSGRDVEGVGRRSWGEERGAAFSGRKYTGPAVHLRVMAQPKLPSEPAEWGKLFKDMQEDPEDRTAVLLGATLVVATLERMLLSWLVPEKAVEDLFGLRARAAPAAES